MSSPALRRLRLDWRATPLLRNLLILAAAIAVAAAIAPGPVPAAGLGCTLLLVACLASEPHANLHVRLSSRTARCTEGDAVSVTLLVTASGPVHVTAVMEPDLFVEAAGQQPWLVGAGQECRFQLRPTSWRVGSPGALRLSVSSRRGGWAAAVRLALPDLAVHPRPQPQPAAYAPPQLLSRLGLHVGRVRGTGTDFAEVRQYASGDPLRDVNWRASARTGELMVSQRFRDQSADVVVVLDHLDTHQAYDRRLTDQAVRGGAAVARAYLAAGDRVGLVLFGSPLRWVAPGQGQVQQLRILDQMVVPPSLDSFLDPAVQRIPGAALPVRAVVFCFTPLLDRRMLDAIGRLTTRGHRLVVVDLAGLEPARWPARVSGASREVWREHRQLLRRRLSQRGVMVVDDPASVLGAVRQMSGRRVA